MRKALIQGWQYALKYPDEIVSLILDKYQSNKDLMALGFESQVITQLLANDVVDIGFMSVNRWRQIDDALAHRSPYLDLEQTQLLLTFDIF
jgi:hypothetical protein